jgi:septum site-determining protein MinC
MAAFNLKAGLNPITTLLLQTNNLADIQEELKAKIEQAPNMFIRLPCIFDFVELEEKIDLPSLYLVCHEFGMLPIGVKNAQADHRELLEQLELADFGKGKSRPPKVAQTTRTEDSINTESTIAEAKIETPIADTSASSVNVTAKTTIHKFPIRSGQQLTAEGDLIIFGLVSTGAEVLAGGSIHIYGPLRGRALAGINGNSNATISCQSLEAELVAIAGEYKLFENSELHTTQATFIQLDNGRLNIESV